jgi:hypothetical protein
VEAHSKFKASTQQTGVTSCQVSYHFIRTSSKYNFQKWLSLNFDNCCLTQSVIKWFHLKYSILFNISLLRTFCTIQNKFIEIKFFVWKKLFHAKNPTYVLAFHFWLILRQQSKFSVLVSTLNLKIYFFGIESNWITRWFSHVS